jgi:hypothetical protein
MALRADAVMPVGDRALPVSLVAMDQQLDELVRLLIGMAPQIVVAGLTRVRPSLRRQCAGARCRLS